MSAVLELRVPCCRRKVRPATLYRHATQVVRRTCPACRRRWAAKLAPLARGAGWLAHVAEWREVPA